MEDKMETAGYLHVSILYLSSLEKILSHFLRSPAKWSVLDSPDGIFLNLKTFSLLFTENSILSKIWKRIVTWKFVLYLRAGPSKLISKSI